MLELFFANNKGHNFFLAVFFAEKIGFQCKLTDYLIKGI